MTSSWGSKLYWLTTLCEKKFLGNTRLAWSVLWISQSRSIDLVKLSHRHARRRLLHGSEVKTFEKPQCLYWPPYAHITLPRAPVFSSSPLSVVSLKFYKPVLVTLSCQARVSACYEVVPQGLWAFLEFLGNAQFSPWKSLKKFAVVFVTASDARDFFFFF